jgi:site-specific DNA-cytosine methylase
MSVKPLVFDLFCGLFGWGEAFAKDGYHVVGFDIENQFQNFGKKIPENCELVVRDIRSINGAELVKTYGVPACIVASPPCQEFSYMAMPWSKAKEKMRKILADPAEQKRLCDLFNQCFRIQREVSSAAGHYVPMVVENVRGAQRWVGKARWNFGSFYLWGDVPALMPIPVKRSIKRKGSMTPGVERWCREGIAPLPEGVKAGDRNKGAKNGEHKWSNSFADTLKGEGNKTAGMNWSDRSKKGQDFTRIAGMQADGVKKRDEGYDCPGRTFGWKAPATTSKSSARKQASAEIAKIPPALAAWIARVFKPVQK